MVQFHDGQRLVHMSRGDVPVWMKFYREKKDKFYNYQYDVRVGGGVVLGRAVPEWLRRDAQKLSEKRIDVVFEDGRYIYLVEIKHRITSSTIGQVISYVLLYRRKFKPVKNVIPVIIGSFTSPDVLESARIQNIKMYIVSEEFS